MGTWGVLVFENDEAADWVYELERARDLSVVESALAEIENAGDPYIVAYVASNALAACEVLARLCGNFGYRDSSTLEVDAWVAANPQRPTPEILSRALAAIDRILGENSELRELWEESDEGADAWRASVEDLRQRLGG